MPPEAAQPGEGSDLGLGPAILASKVFEAWKGFPFQRKKPFLE